MALKKLKPLSPDPSMSKTKGDNELARLAHVNDIVNKFRKVHQFEVPQSGDIINIYPNHVETIVTFKDLLTNDFTINVVTDSHLSPNLGPGDRMYIFVEGSCTVTFTGNITPTQCGGSDNVYDVGDPLCLEVVYSGTQFLGIDNC
jgi:hypothetical protein